MVTCSRESGIFLLQATAVCLRKNAIDLKCCFSLYFDETQVNAAQVVV